MLADKLSSAQNYYRSEAETCSSSGKPANKNIHKVGVFCFNALNPDTGLF